MTDKVSFLIVGGGENNAFERILTEQEIAWHRISLSDFPGENPADYDGLIFLPGYFEWGDDLAFKKRVLQAIKNFRQLGRSFYGEYIQSDDYPLADAFIFKQNYPPRPAGLERAFVSQEHYITQDFAMESILPLRNCSFLPGQRRAAVLLAIASVPGNHLVLERPAEREIWPALLSLEGSTEVTGEGGTSIEGRRWLFATFELSRYAELDFPLPAQWEKLLRRIILYLLPDAAREAMAPRMMAFKSRSHLQGSVAGAGSSASYRHTLDSLIGWYLDSGVMPAPDGSEGVFEGFRSFDHKLIPVMRSDCNAETALAFAVYSAMAGNEAFLEKAENIMAFLQHEGWQDLNAANATCGLWKFYDDYEPFTAVGYGNDNGEVVRALFTLFDRTGKRQYLESAMLTCERFLELGMHLRLDRIEGRQLNRLGTEEYVRQGRDAGIYSDFLVHDDVAIAYLYAFRHTGEERFLKAVTDSCADGSPRDFFLLAFLYRLTGDNAWLDLLDKEILEVKRQMLPCGALKGQYRFGDLTDHHLDRTTPLYGLSETDIRHQKEDPVVDLLYMNCKLALNLYSSFQAAGREEYLDLFHRVAAFLTAVQVRSADKRLNGAWMRAFDYEYWDYYGSNGDVDWGPYCIESGWSNAWAGMALGLYLSGKSLIP